MYTHFLPCGFNSILIFERRIFLYIDGLTPKNIHESQIIPVICWGGSLRLLKPSLYPAFIVPLKNILLAKKK